ncbi:hypothetical protein D3C79_760210 [compost metagenome]
MVDLSAGLLLSVVIITTEQASGRGYTLHHIGCYFLNCISIIPDGLVLITIEGYHSNGLGRHAGLLPKRINAV